MSLPANGTQNRQTIRPRKTFQGHAYRVNCIINLPGRQQIMTCSTDSLLRVWDLESGGQIGNDLRDGKHGVYRIALSPDGRKIICVDGYGVVRLRDIDSGKVIREWTNTECNSVCWSQDGGRILSGSFDGTAREWDVENGETMLEINTGLSNIRAVIYSPDGMMIATSGNDDMEKEFLKIWDAETGKLVKNLKGHTDDVTCLAWTADGSKLISGSHDFSIRIWDTTTWQQITIFTGHINLVLAIAISPNGHILASASFDKTVRLWNLENGHLIGSPLQHPSPVNCISFSTDGKLLVTGCGNGNVYTWDIFAIEDGLI